MKPTYVLKYFQKVYNPLKKCCIKVQKPNFKIYGNFDVAKKETNCKKNIFRNKTRKFLAITSKKG